MKKHMETKCFETRKCYQVYGKDETGLIPEETSIASIFYDEVSRVNRVDFLPKPTNAYTLEECEKSQQLLKRLNPPRTREEMEKIISRLESSLQNSQ